MSLLIFQSLRAVHPDLQKAKQRWQEVFTDKELLKKHCHIKGTSQEVATGICENI